MTKLWQNLSRHWQDGLNVLLGIWLFISPWVLQLTATQAFAWNAWIFGALIAVAAVAAVMWFVVWEEWVNAAIGIWLIVAPWLLGFSTQATAMWNNVVVGVLTAGLALWSIAAAKEHAPAIN